MLADSVDQVRGTPAYTPPPAEIDLCVNAFIPEEYMADTSVRTDFYKRLVAAADTDRVDRIAEEIEDRFGKPPRPLSHFLLQCKIRTLAAAVGIAKIKAHPNSELTDITFHKAESMMLFRKMPYPADFDLEAVYLNDRVRLLHQGARPTQLLKSIFSLLKTASEVG